jgi:hypothetical protein
VKRIKDVVGNNPVYSNVCSFVALDLELTYWTVTLDIDVIDPGLAPA